MVTDGIVELLVVKLAGMVLVDLGEQLFPVLMTRVVRSLRACVHACPRVCTLSNIAHGVGWGCPKVFCIPTAPIRDEGLREATYSRELLVNVLQKNK